MTEYEIQKIRDMALSLDPDYRPSVMRKRKEGVYGK